MAASLSPGAAVPAAPRPPLLCLCCSWARVTWQRLAPSATASWVWALAGGPRWRLPSGWQSLSFLASSATMQVCVGGGLGVRGGGACLLAGRAHHPFGNDAGVGVHRLCVCVYVCKLGLEPPSLVPGCPLPYTLHPPLPWPFPDILIPPGQHAPSLAYLDPVPPPPLAEVMAAVREVLPIAVAMLPINAAVYVFDGVITGASDFKFMAGGCGHGRAGQVGGACVYWYRNGGVRP